MFWSENKLPITLVSAISVIFLLVAYVLYQQYQHSLESHYHKFGGLVARTVASGSVDRVQAPLSAKLKVKQYVDHLLDNHNDLLAVEFNDAEGNTLYQNRKITHQDKITKNIRTYTAKLEDESITGDNQYLGTVSIQMSGETVDDIAQATRTMLLVIFFCAWLLTIFAIFANTVFIQKHLRRLLQGVKRLSTGDFGYRINEDNLWGELRAIAESFNDMSQRLRVYEDQNLDTITLERNKLESVLMSIADGTIVCDRDGMVAIINDSACQHLTVENAESIIGQHIENYLSVDGKRSLETLLDDYNEHVRQPSPPVFTQQVTLPDTTLLVSVNTIQDIDGQDLGYVITTRDITREAEVDKLKTNFISNVSHELRTPVTTIKSYVDTLYNHADDLDEATYKEFMETLHLETDRMKKMVNDILDFSKLQESGETLEKSEQDMTPIINLTVQSFKVLAQQKDLTITTNIESNLPPLWINSDTIERVMRNLLGNAIKYTGESGRIKVRAELIDDGETIDVSVHDTGIGIPEKYLPQIFDRFFRVENDVHTVKGTGLGLHLVKVAIEKHHGGEVYVKSTEGEGSTFGFRLKVPEKATES